MTIQQTAGSSKLSWKQIVVIFVAIAYVAFNGFRIGGDAFVIALNNNIVIPLAIVVTLLTIILWRRMARGGHSRVLWTGLAIGWALWTIAEFWWGFAAIIGQEVPYPSWADFFWLAGYIPMSIALWERIRSLPRNITSMQRAGIWGSVLLSVGWTIWFVLIPILQNNDPAAVLESILNILFPLADLILLVLVLRIFFTYQQGMVGRAWGWLSAGFILHSLSNLIFSYASTADLYYPDGHVNLISTLGVDVPYNLAYLLWLVGLWIVYMVHNTHRVFPETNTTLETIPNTHLLVFTKGDDLVIDVSRNYSQVFLLETVLGSTVAEALGVSREEADALLGENKTKHILTEREVILHTRFGQRKARVSGISIFNPGGEYAGTTLLLRMPTEGRSLDEILPDSQKRMVRSLLNKTGAQENEEREIRQFLSAYYLAYFHAFYNRIFAEGGSVMVDAFINELQSVAQKHNWLMDIRSDALLDVNAQSLSTTREALPILFEAAKRFVARILDETTADAIVQDVRSRFDASTQTNVAYFEKARD